MNSNKTRLIRLIICPPWLYFWLEKWLKKMSLLGWHLVKRRLGCIYFFQKGTPKEKEYFVWDGTCIGDGKYSIDLRYPSLEKTYGVKKKKSTLNKNSMHDYIIEVDTKRIDIYNDLYYNELKSDRNRLYFLRFLRNFAVFALLFLIFFILCLLI